MSSEGNPVLLFIIIGFTLLCFFVWLGQSLFKRRKLENDMRNESDDGSEPSEDASSDKSAQH